MLVVCVAVQGEWLQRTQSTFNTCMQRAGRGKGEQRVQALVLLWVVFSRARLSSGLHSNRSVRCCSYFHHHPKDRIPAGLLALLVVQSMHFH